MSESMDSVKRTELAVAVHGYVHGCNVNIVAELLSSKRLYILVYDVHQEFQVRPREGAVEPGSLGSIRKEGGRGCDERIPRRNCVNVNKVTEVRNN
jgi:hypothetical protein